MDLVEKIISCHRTLRDADIPHAFGGALALAWCTQQARGTIDIDLNVFLGADQIAHTLKALPQDINWSSADLDRLTEELQHRLWWQKTPLDLFFNSTDYHEEVADRVRWESFAGEHVPFLSCIDLAAFKVIFNRTKDWADLEAMQDAGTLDHDKVRGIVTRFLASNDSRVLQLERLRSEQQPEN